MSEEVVVDFAHVDALQDEAVELSIAAWQYYKTHGGHKAPFTDDPEMIARFGTDIQESYNYAWQYYNTNGAWSHIHTLSVCFRAINVLRSKLGWPVLPYDSLVLHGLQLAKNNPSDV
jgi:hypothetical protein